MNSHGHVHLWLVKVQYTHGHVRTWSCSWSCTLMIKYTRGYVRSWLCLWSVTLMVKYTLGTQGTALCRVDVNGPSIPSNVSDSIVHSWLRSTATFSYPLGYFSSITTSS